MALAEGNVICDIVSNLAENGRGVEGNEFELCELKGKKFQLGKFCDSNHAFVSAVFKVQVRDTSIFNVVTATMSTLAFIKPKTIFQCPQNNNYHFQCLCNS